MSFVELPKLLNRSDMFFHSVERDVSRSVREGKITQEQGILLYKKVCEIGLKKLSRQTKSVGNKAYVIALQSLNGELSKLSFFYNFCRLYSEGISISKPQNEQFSTISAAHSCLYELSDDGIIAQSVVSSKCSSDSEDGLLPLEDENKKEF